MQMVKYIRVIGPTIKQMVKVLTNIVMGATTQATGSMICKMAKDLNIINMEHSTMETSEMERRMVMVV